MVDQRELRIDSCAAAGARQKQKTGAGLEGKTEHKTIISLVELLLGRHTPTSSHALQRTA